MNKTELKPARVFEQFAKINQIPRPSKHEDKMIAYLKDFAKRPQRATRTALLSYCRVTWTWCVTSWSM